MSSSFQLSLNPSTQMSDGDAQELCLQHAQHTPEEIANHVLTLALARGTRDNLSCLIVKLK